MAELRDTGRSPGTTRQVQCLNCGTLREPAPAHAAETPCAKCQHYGWVFPPGDFPVPLDRGGVWGQIDCLNVLPFPGATS